MHQLKHTYYCQNLKEHKDNKPVLVTPNDKYCPECKKELAWNSVTKTSAVYPLDYFLRNM